MADELDALLARGRASGTRLAVLQEEMDAERGRRDALIVDMRDAGVAWGKIGAAVRLSPSMCSSIVADYPDPVEVTTSETVPG